MPSNTNNEKYTYHCLGCKKEFHTYKFYPHGWICLSCRDKIKLTLKCSVCGTDVKVNWDTYRMKDPNIPWRCRSCNDKYRNEVYENRSDEYKQAFHDSQSARSKEYYANRTQEEIEADSQRRKDLWKKRKEDGSGQKIIDAMVAGRAAWYDSLSGDEKIRYLEIRETGKAKWWAGLTKEEKMAHMKYPHDGFKKWFNELSEIEKKMFMNPLWEGNYEFWKNMTPEKYIEWKIKQATGYRLYIETCDPKSPYVSPNTNEKKFIEYLESSGIQYIFQYPNVIVDDEFFEKFPYSRVTKADFVDPTHYWDFIVHTLYGDILIDIDGSMHYKDTYTKTHPYTGVVYKELDYKKEKETQRPYQTEGMDAYAILCYDDKLTPLTPVINIKTNEQMLFKDLINLLEWLNLPEEYQDQILSEFID